MCYRMNGIYQKRNKQSFSLTIVSEVKINLLMQSNQMNLSCIFIPNQHFVYILSSGGY